MAQIPLSNRVTAEFVGTLWLVLGGCGSAVLAAGVPDCRDRVSRCVARIRAHRAHHGVRHRSHLGLSSEPGSVASALWSGGDSRPELLPYIIAQVLGASPARRSLYLIASGKAGFDLEQRFASNGYGEHSPGGYSLGRGLVCEVVMTFMFLMIILGATDRRAPQGFAPIAIGLGLTLIHLISIPVTNTSVNPARSTGPAVFVGGWALAQLWLFWVAPLIGAILARDRLSDHRGAGRQPGAAGHRHPEVTAMPEREPVGRRHSARPVTIGP